VTRGVIQRVHDSRGYAPARAVDRLQTANGPPHALAPGRGSSCLARTGCHPQSA
jgi:hypothetical protein